MMMFSRFISRSVSGGRFVQPAPLAFDQHLAALRKFKKPLVHRAHEAKGKRRQHANQQPAQRVFASKKKRAEKISTRRIRKIARVSRWSDRIHRLRGGKKLPAEPEQRQQPEPFCQGERLREPHDLIFRSPEVSPHVFSAPLPAQHPPPRAEAKSSLPNGSARLHCK